MLTEDGEDCVDHGGTLEQIANRIGCLMIPDFPAFVDQRQKRVPAEPAP